MKTLISDNHIYGNDNDADCNSINNIFLIENFQPRLHPMPLVAFTKYSNRRKPAANERPHSITIKYCSKKDEESFNNRDKVC